MLTKVDIENCASLAQLDRVPGYEPGGRRFESSRTRHLLKGNALMLTKVDIENCASLAQLDRVPGYEPGGRRFESSRTRHLLKKPRNCEAFLYLDIWNMA